jgi:hypothetical protein
MDKLYTGRCIASSLYSPVQGILLQLIESFVELCGKLSLGLSSPYSPVQGSLSAVATGWAGVKVPLLGFLILFSRTGFPSCSRMAWS